MVICRFFQQGSCLKGDTCNFEHPPSIISTVSSGTSFNPVAEAGHQIVRTQEPCIFFLQGACKWGTSCRYRHDVTLPTPPTFNGASYVHTGDPSDYGSHNLPDQPGSRATANSSLIATKDTRSETPCAFFLRNTCKRGDSCLYSHALGGAARILHNTAAAPLSTPTLFGPKDRNLLIASNAMESHGFISQSKIGPFSRLIGGSTVEFEDGAAVSTLLLPSDFSLISLSRIPGGKTVHDICTLLKTYGMDDVSPESVMLKTMPHELSQAAQIKVADVNFASKLFNFTGPTIDIDGSTVSVSVVQAGSASESGTNRLQLTNVVCTWHNPSKTAQLEFAEAEIARRSMTRIQKEDVQLCGRKLTVIHNMYSPWVKLGNLNVQSTESELRRVLPRPPPRKIIVGKYSHSRSQKELEDGVLTSLEERGTVNEWVMTSHANASKAKAFAKFESPEAARKAVQELNDTRIDPVSKDKLHLQLIVSIKMSTSRRVFEAIRPQLDLLSKESWTTSHVSIKSYYNPTKPHTQMRVYGSDREAVARVKSSVEKLLAGHIALNGTEPISQAFFFQEASSVFFAELMKIYDVSITRDLRKMVLRLFGDPEKVRLAEEALVVKSVGLSTQSKNIILNPTTLYIALKGGFRKIVASIGKDKARLDISSKPKCIIISGTEQDVEKATKILNNYDLGPLEDRTKELRINDEIDNEEELCPVCWTPPEEPFTTKCGHIYCSACLASQCTSATGFPVRCLGKSATCNAALPLQDLKQVMTISEYENLLNTSFMNYIRNRPNEFQYCSTPDCDRFYRTSSTKSPYVFNCDGCLTSICTSCHHIAHDGFSCAAYKAAQDGTDEFAEWKKENDVRDCPKCAAPIEKNFGCNHMECISCRIHICWFCMKTYHTGNEVYRHMAKAHDN